VTWATSVPILVFLGLSVLDLGPTYATDRRQTASSLNAPAYYWRGHFKLLVSSQQEIVGTTFWRILYTQTVPAYMGPEKLGQWGHTPFELGM